MKGLLQKWARVIDKPIWELLTFGQNPFLNILDTFFLILGPRSHNAHPLKLISGPCSIEIIYPCEWRIAIPASSMGATQQTDAWINRQPGIQTSIQMLAKQINRHSDSPDLFHGEPQDVITL